VGVSQTLKSTHTSSHEFSLLSPQRQGRFVSRFVYVAGLAARPPALPHIMSHPACLQNPYHISCGVQRGGKRLWEGWGLPTFSFFSAACGGEKRTRRSSRTPEVWRPAIPGLGRRPSALPPGNPATRPFPGRETLGMTHKRRRREGIG
jgi:hypothetical protein